MQPVEPPILTVQYCQNVYLAATTGFLKHRTWLIVSNFAPFFLVSVTIFKIIILFSELNL